MGICFLYRPFGLLDNIVIKLFKYYGKVISLKITRISHNNRYDLVTLWFLDFHRTICSPWSR